MYLSSKLWHCGSLLVKKSPIMILKTRIIGGVRKVKFFCFSHVGNTAEIVIDLEA